MLLILAIFSLSYNYDADYLMDENGIGRKLRRAARKIGHVGRKITKPITKPIERGIRSAKKWVYDRGQHLTIEPIRIVSFTPTNIERDYSSNDLLSLAHQIANEFHLDLVKVIQYFNRCKWSVSSKQLFNRIDFGQVQQDKDQRTAYLGGTIIKVTKVNGQYQVNCRQAAVSALIQATRTMHYFKRRFGHKSRSHVPEWRALTAGEITQVYQQCNNQIAARLNNYKYI